MHLIVAIFRPEKLNDVLEALYRADVRGLTVSRVMGHGGETEHAETYRGTTVKVALQEKVRTGSWSRRSRPSSPPRARVK
jgi:nitrogen regulatory protein P-II 1